MLKSKIMKPISEKSLNLLLKHEVGGGQRYYEKYLSSFTWPGGASGPTIGIGIDCAYYSKDELEKMFDYLDDHDLELVLNASGKTGESGRTYARKLREAGIKMSWDKAIDIFEEKTWAKFSRLAEKIYPDLKYLCDDAYGAVVSIVFNRGASLSGASRVEMKNLINLISSKNYKGIAAEIRKMKRLWVGKGMDGLIRRREDEALLVESCS